MARGPHIVRRSGHAHDERHSGCRPVSRSDATHFCESQRTSISEVHARVEAGRQCTRQLGLMRWWIAVKERWNGLDLVAIRPLSLRMPSVDRTWRGQDPRPDLPRGTDILPQIKHIVVLMMQGHSYDNYLGSQSGRGDGFPLTSSGEPVGSNPAYSGTPVAVHHLSSTVQRPDAPSDTQRASRIQWNGGDRNGFVRSVQETSPGAPIDASMGYWTADDLPFINSLAETFPVADRWFSSCLGPSLPNRRFLVAGTGAARDHPPNGTISTCLPQATSRG